MKLLKKIATRNNLKLSNGIYFSNKSKNEYSYPQEGSSLCFNVEDNSYWFKHRNDCIISVVKTFVNKINVILDIGGGNGFVTAGLNKSGYSSILVDPSIKGILNAKKRGIKDLVCANFQDLNIKSNSIEAVGLFDVIEHIKKDNIFLNKIYAILKENGILVITVPAYEALFSKEDEFAGHYRRYSLKSINKILNRLGFSIIYKTYFFSFLLIPIFFFRYLPSKLNNQTKKAEINYTKQHSIDNYPILNKVMLLFLKWELFLVKKLIKIPFGSSCLIVAKKINRE